MGVASSSPHTWVDGHLTRLDLYSYFDTIMCKDDVINTKPDPELYLATLSALNIQAEEAIVFEDSPNGILAANRAGIFCVAVPNPITSQLPLGHANLHISSMAEISLEALLIRIQGIREDQRQRTQNP